MSGPDEASEELQKIWQEGRANAAEQEISMIVRLVREKQRSFQDLVRAQNLTVYLFSLSFAPLTGLAAWKAHPWMPFGLGYLIMTATLVIGAALVWFTHRSILRPIDLSVRDYHRQLLQWYDKRIRLTTTSSYWYALPLILGAGLVLYPATRLLPAHWGLVLLAALFVLLARVTIGTSLRGVADLRRQREEVRSLIEEMDRG